MTHATTAALAIALLLAGAPARAQSGGAYDLRHNTIDGGGATFSSGAGYSLGGTIGQPDAGRLSGGSYELAGGFWPGIEGSAPAATPTATATAAFTASASPSRTSTGTVAATATPSRTAMPSAIATPTRTAVQTVAGTATPTTATTETPNESPTPTPSPSPTEDPDITPAAACAGDCNLDDTVAIAELLRLVNIALGNASVETCAAGDSNRDGVVTINEVLRAVTSALNGCG